jgi:hypothetical protein
VHKIFVGYMIFLSDIRKVEIVHQAAFVEADMHLAVAENYRPRHLEDSLVMF